MLRGQAFGDYTFGRAYTLDTQGVTLWGAKLSGATFWGATLLEASLWGGGTLWLHLGGYTLGSYTLRSYGQPVWDLAGHLPAL